MTRLLWDQAGTRFYEAGVDRGVLYLSDGTGVPWNGLTSIDDDAGSDSSEPRYFDGIKYADQASIGDYEATLNAFTYPDEFLDYEGVEELGNGLYVDGQQSNLFGLSYRTQVGNDLLGTDLGYKIHLVYNLTATPDVKNYETLSDTSSPMQFGWKITGVPEDAPGYRPTAHVIFDSRLLNATLFSNLEDVLYGDVDQNASLPTIEELLDFVSLFGPRHILPQSVSGLAQLATVGSGDLTPSNVDGVYTALPTTRLIDANADGVYTLNP